MKAEFEDYHSSCVATQMKKRDVADVMVDLRLSIIKPLHAKWLLKTCEDIGKKQELVRKAWGMAGIV